VQRYDLILKQPKYSLRFFEIFGHVRENS
jgi:hypothetical protein